ncbi:hypothetical protein V5O48_015074 [Marasmius crinis-equi]|uniref:Glycoside hydrolase family 76 protein n=1 Tax=Marasmius crinis-equi TaxID=585013 RepID=A0ABR3EVJ8_9AGAR
MFMLSALLADSAPSNATYVTAALQSLAFLDRVLIGEAVFHSPTGCPQPIVISGATEVTQTTSFNAFLMEALAVLHPLSHNKTEIESRLQSEVTAALSRMSLNLLNLNGILPNQYRPQDSFLEAEDGDMYLLRALAAVFRVIGTNLSSDIRDTVKAVLGVHYNAIRDHATAGNNVYSRDWSGPPTPVSFDLYNQAAAAQILVDGIDLFDAPTSSPIPSQPLSSLSSSHAASGIIAGATTGGLVFLVMVATIAFLVIRRRRSQNSPSAEFAAQGITPYTNFGQNLPSEKSSIPRDTHWNTKDRHLSLTASVPLALAAPSQKALDETLPTSPTDSASVRQENGDTGTETAARTPNTHQKTPTEMELAPGFPDMVRAVYQRLWKPDSSENPPDYRSNADESQG